MAEEHGTVEERLLAFFTQGRSALVTDSDHLVYVTGLTKSSVKAALARLETSGHIRMGRDGRWALK